MKRNFKTLLISGLCALAAVPVLASNPIVKGWYADPEIRIFDGQYWIYPTYSDHYGTLDTSPEFTDAQKDLRKNKMVRPRSEEHTSELQSLMRISYAVFCLKKKKKHKQRLTQQDAVHLTS